MRNLFPKGFTSFYKYKALDNIEFVLDMLIRERLYCSKLHDLNDPMEGVIKSDVIDADTTQSDWLRIIDSTRVACFTTEPNNPLMWSHYADGGRGCVIEFELPTFKLPHKVSYHKKPVLTRKEIDVIKTLELLSYKDNYWRYEREYRVILLKSEASNFIPIKVKGVRFGPRANKDKVELISHILRMSKPMIGVRQEVISGVINPIKLTSKSIVSYEIPSEYQGCKECYKRDSLIDSFSYRPRIDNYQYEWGNGRYSGKD
ncbi:DUF2971 domain-containing protein [Rheinheimera sp.]|uniref:DUF2971 domain-containing protein n=1 Tax=Rheinheimera sp. TaxID=1869214 RepID=UPI002353E4C5|nr:DUF2971 domain-containing protein [Rheinheimera sp.]|tara:strand:- start:397 stop:1173 length:777 start_codon:yes stop_codon:yes gene_type:complete